MSTVTPAHAQTVAPGPYYATPSWDQTLPASARFIVLSNMKSEAVLDRETGLVWQRSPSTNDEIWRVSLQRCSTLIIADRRAWRLPRLEELASLLDLSRTQPALPAGHPFLNVQNSTYWTANSNIENSTYAIGVSFYDSNLSEFNNKGDRNFYWCVRGGGQGLDAQ
jgi:hypothetical protein